MDTGLLVLSKCKILAALALLAAAAATHAAEVPYPSRPIRMVVPSSPGASMDATARAYGGWLAEKLGVNVVIDNRAGAGTTLGHALAAKALPDGYTVLLGASSGLVVGPALGMKVSYDPVKDFAPVGVNVYVPFVLVVHPALPASNVKELVELGKAQPGKINFASPGTGTPNHLGVELLMSMTGAHFTHVPYRGGGLVTADLLSGRIQAMFGSMPQWQPHLATGRVRAIAVGHPTRLRSMPDVPAVAETLPGFNNTSWYGLVAPVGTPAAIINKLNTETSKAAANPEFARHIESVGLEPASSTPKEMGDLIRTELARWTRIIKAAGIKPE